MLKYNFFHRTCRPYLEVLPNGFCKPYISNQLVSVNDERARKNDIYLHGVMRMIKESFIKRERENLLQDINSFVKSMFLL